MSIPLRRKFYKKFGAALFTYLGTYYIMIVDEQRQMHFDAPEKQKYVKNVKLRAKMVDIETKM